MQVLITLSDLHQICIRIGFSVLIFPIFLLQPEVAYDMLSLFRCVVALVCQTGNCYKDSSRR